MAVQATFSDVRKAARATAKIITDPIVERARFLAKEADEVGELKLDEVLSRETVRHLPSVGGTSLCQVGVG